MSRRGVTLGVMAFLLAGFGRPVAAGGEPDDGFKTELKGLAGTWVPVSAESDGGKVPDNILKDSKWIFGADGKMVHKGTGNADAEFKVTKIDTAKKPKTLDMEVVSHTSLEKGLTLRCAYDLNGDTLRVCMPFSGKAEYPKEITAGKGSQRTVIVLKREKK